MVYAIYVINVTASDAILIDRAWAVEECEACEITFYRVTSSVRFIKSSFNFSFLAIGLSFYVFHSNNAQFLL